MTSTQRAYIFRAAVVAALGGFLFGYDTAIINGALVFLKQGFHWSEVQTEIAASSLLFGCLIGASVAGTLSDWAGRRRILLLAAVVFAVSSVASAFPNDLTQFCIVRIVAGTAIGMASMLSPLYIAEISPAKTRGMLVSMNQLAIVTGILVSYLTGYLMAGIGQESWRWMLASAALPSALFFGTLFTVPESPRWLVKEGREDEAAGILQKLGEPVERLEEMKSAIAEEQGSIWQLFEPGLRIPLLIGVTMAVLQQVTGINTIIYYSSTIFKEQAGASSATDALLPNVIIGLVNLICTLAALALIDRLGRKSLLLIASGGMGVALMLLGVVFKTSPHSPWILVFMLCYVAAFSLGMGPTVWVIMAELFPTRIRGRAMSIATIALWAACMLIASTFLSLVTALTIAGAFWTYAAMCAFTFVFVWRMVPETKGKSLEEIERAWKR